MKSREPESNRTPRGDALENEFRAMFAERSETVRVTTAPYAAVRQRITAARHKRRMRIGSVGVAFAMAAVGIGVWTAVPSRHQSIVQPGTTDPHVPAAILYADGRTPIPNGPLQDAALTWLRATYKGNLSGLTVVTTFDQAVQAAATAKIADHDAGVAVVDDRDGAVLALGGTWNRPLPIADLMKPVLLAEAFEGGHYTPQSKEPLDAQTHPVSLPGSPQPLVYAAAGDQTRNWPPESPTTQIDNIDVSLTRAAQMGANEPFAQLELASDMDLRSFYGFATRAGMAKEPDLLPVASLVLGMTQQTPLAMASVYATLSNGGFHRDPVMVAQLLGPDGRVVWIPPAVAVRVTTANSSQQVAEVLHAALLGPTGNGLTTLQTGGASTGAMAAASPEETSAWVTGVDSHYVVSVGISSEDGKGRLLPLGPDQHGGLDVGSRIAGPTWASVVRAVRSLG
ncbi:penicillin-binding transpeptidase domain-containing protein [Catenulispora rubra]|uniref:penicillin-binding transpeptidase domain-containing protein n=1 Tax=Catenulispora rubra TaxID=280293 RepID=UPI001892830E|nr:penicillin-binding transpeptidase domain-containing protein [Catenulispora rubra]